MLRTRVAWAVLCGAITLIQCGGDARTAKDIEICAALAEPTYPVEAIAGMDTDAWAEREPHVAEFVEWLKEHEATLDGASAPELQTILKSAKKTRQTLESNKTVLLDRSRTKGAVTAHLSTIGDAFRYCNPSAPSKADMQRAVERYRDNATR